MTLPYPTAHNGESSRTIVVSSEMASVPYRDLVGALLHHMMNDASAMDNLRGPDYDPSVQVGNGNKISVSGSGSFRCVTSFDGM